MNTKRLLLVLALLGISSLPLSAQTLASVSHAITHDTTLATTPKNGLSGGIVDDNNSWATLWHAWVWIPPKEEHLGIKTEYVYFDGDSIVGDHSYKKVFMCDDALHENVEYKGLMREENQKTYFIFPKSGMEYLLYDFSLEKGMTFEHYHSLRLFEIINSDTVEINGVLKKRLQISYAPSSLYNYVVDTWIEDVGSLLGILYPCVIFNGSQHSLLCYFQNNELIYKNPEYPKCYYEEGEDITSVQTIVNNDCYVFPNPVDDVLTVSSSNNTLLKIEIFNMLGQKVYNQSHGNTIDISSSPTGLYFLKVYDTNEQVTIFKIIKR